MAVKGRIFKIEIKKGATLGFTLPFRGLVWSLLNNMEDLDPRASILVSIKCHWRDI